MFVIICAAAVVALFLFVSVGLLVEWYGRNRVIPYAATHGDYVMPSKWSDQRCGPTLAELTAERRRHQDVA
jgi:hypothetical protein